MKFSLECIHPDEDDSECPFFDPAIEILQRLNSPEDFPLDNGEGEINLDTNLVMYSKNNNAAESPNAITALIGDYHTMRVGKSSGTLSIRDIILMRRNSGDVENSRSVVDLGRNSHSRYLREIDNPDVNVMAWLDCIDIVFDGMTEIGYCSHEIEDGITVTAWLDEKEVYVKRSRRVCHVAITCLPSFSFQGHNQRYFQQRHVVENYLLRW